MAFPFDRSSERIDYKISAGQRGGKGGGSVSPNCMASRLCHASALRFGHKHASRKSHGYNRRKGRRNRPPGAWLPYVDSTRQPEKLPQEGGTSAAMQISHTVQLFGLDIGKNVTR